MKTDPPKPLPEKIVTAWEKAGAEVGWLRVDHDAYSWFVREQVGKPGDVPAFCFSSIVWQRGLLAKLPPRRRRSGLELGFTKVTDAGLKELAGLKSLQSLNLGHTKVTDAGLKALAGLKDLQSR